MEEALISLRETIESSILTDNLTVFDTAIAFGQRFLEKERLHICHLAQVLGGQRSFLQRGKKCVDSGISIVEFPFLEASKRPHSQDTYFGKKVFNPRISQECSQGSEVGQFKVELSEQCSLVSNFMRAQHDFLHHTATFLSPLTHWT